MRDIQKEVKMIFQDNFDLSENFKLSRYFRENRAKNFDLFAY